MARELHKRAQPAVTRRRTSETASVILLPAWRLRLRVCDIVCQVPRYVQYAPSDVQDTTPRDLTYPTLAKSKGRLYDDYSTPVQAPQCLLLWHRIIATSYSQRPERSPLSPEPSESLGTRGSSARHCAVQYLKSYLYLTPLPPPPCVVRIECFFPSLSLPPPLYFARHTCTPARPYARTLVCFCVLGAGRPRLPTEPRHDCDFVWFPIRCNPTSAVAALISACHWVLPKGHWRVKSRSAVRYLRRF